MSQLFGTSIRSESLNAMSTHEHANSDQVQGWPIPDASAPETVTPEVAPVSGRHRAAGKPAKPAKIPKPAKAPKAEKEPKAAKHGDPEVTAGLVAEPADAPPRRRRFGRLRTGLRFIGLPVVALVTIGCFAGAIVLAVTNHAPHQARPLNADTKAALAAANHDVKDILSYDYRQIDTNVSTAKSEITGQLLTDYTSSASKILVQAPPIKAIVTATVSAQSVVQAQSDRVTLLIYVDQESVKQLAGTKSPTTRIDPVRVQMTMTKIKGRWMASQLTPL
jgi:Mce-associated membrane protein